jgi:hypothetical protein
MREGNWYFSMPKKSSGMSGPEGVVLRSLMREVRLLAVMLVWAYLRLWSSMSGLVLASVMVVIHGRKEPVAINLHFGRWVHPSKG